MHYVTCNATNPLDAPLTDAWDGAQELQLAVDDNFTNCSWQNGSEAAIVAGVQAVNITVAAIREDTKCVPPSPAI